MRMAPIMYQTKTFLCLENKKKKKTATKLRVGINLLIFLSSSFSVCFHFLVFSVTYKQLSGMRAIAKEGIFDKKKCYEAPENVPIYKPTLPAYTLQGNKLANLASFIDRQNLTKHLFTPFQ